MTFKEFILCNNRVKAPQLPRRENYAQGEMGHDLFLNSYEGWKNEMTHRQNLHVFGTGKWFAGIVGDLTSGQITNGDPRIFIPIMFFGIVGSAIHVRAYFETRNQIRRSLETV